MYCSFFLKRRFKQFILIFPSLFDINGYIIWPKISNFNFSIFAQNIFMKKLNEIMFLNIVFKGSLICLEYINYSNRCYNIHIRFLDSIGIWVNRFTPPSWSVWMNGMTEMTTFWIEMINLPWMWIIKIATHFFYMSQNPTNSM